MSVGLCCLGGRRCLRLRGSLSRIRLIATVCSFPSSTFVPSRPMPWAELTVPGRRWKEEEKPAIGRNKSRYPAASYRRSDGRKGMASGFMNRGKACRNC
jgi:hypothetical protein